MKLKITSILTYLSAVVLLMPSLVSCRDSDDGPDSVAPVVTNILTYNGGRAYTYVLNGDEGEVALTADIEVQSVAKNDRVLARYTPLSGSENLPGAIALQSLAVITSGDVEAKNLSDFDLSATTPVWVNSIWRTGGYINFNIKIPFNRSPRQFALVADQSTVDGPVLVTVLNHVTPPGDMYDKQYFASFNLTPLLAEHPGITAIEVQVNNSNLLVNKFTFNLNL